mmetsp:Transcript_58470/g.132403  ORF Transcript_58470/g.132403 Transcript_58470/m.132403 type:complete len:95 (-) Transcript_58470:298-582(-)
MVGLKRQTEEFARCGAGFASKAQREQRHRPPPPLSALLSSVLLGLLRFSGPAVFGSIAAGAVEPREGARDISTGDAPESLESGSLETLIESHRR